jgi:hypothetical protein
MCTVLSTQSLTFLTIVPPCLMVGTGAADLARPNFLLVLLSFVCRCITSLVIIFPTLIASWTFAVVMHLLTVPASEFEAFSR